MWTLPSLDLDKSNVANWDVSQKSKTEMANSVDPDEMVCYTPSHQDPLCL